MFIVNHSGFYGRGTPFKNDYNNTADYLLLSRGTI